MVEKKITRPNIDYTGKEMQAVQCDGTDYLLSTLGKGNVKVVTIFPIYIGSNFFDFGKGSFVGNLVLL